jgi:hypothetical protein
MTRELLTMRMLEAVLSGFAAGRRLLAAASNLGLSNNADAPGLDKSVGTGEPASWWDLAASHPAAVLGVLLLSRPEMPLGAFLRAAATRDAAVVPAGAVRMHRLADEVDEVEAVSGDVEGGHVWGHGHLTAVGAGDAGKRGSWSLFVPVWEPREHDSMSGVVVVQEEGVGADRHDSIVSRLGAVLAMLFGGKKCTA